MDQRTFCVRIQGISLRLQTNSNTYIKYLKNYFAYLEQDPSIEADIEVTLDLEESVAPATRLDQWKQSDGLKRIGRRILVNDNEVVWDGINQLNNLKLRCVYEEKTKIFGQISLVRSAYLIKRFYQQVVRKRQFDDYKFDVYAALTYYLIYYPVLYQLEQKNISPLHASAVVSGGRRILMPGLPGVGKSTLCLAFLAAQNAKFLSDNIVLYDTNCVYSFFEPLKLDSYGMSLIDFNKEILIKIGSDSYYDRNSFRVEEDTVIESMRPDILLIPMRSSETYLTPISAQQATQLNCDFNNIAGEVNSYLIYSSVQNLCHKNDTLAKNRIERLKTLCESMDCFMLSVKSGQPLDDVMNTIHSSW